MLGFPIIFLSLQLKYGLTDQYVPDIYNQIASCVSISD